MSKASSDKATQTLKFIILTRIDRRAFAFVLSLTVFSALIVVSVLTQSSMRRVIETADALWWVFSPMLTAIITAVALVVTFTQLVLSQELGALGDQHQRMQEAIEFRESVDPWLRTQTAPPDPASFLAALLESVGSIADDLETNVKGPNDEKFERIDEFSSTISESTRAVRTMLEDAQFGTFSVVEASLQFDYSKNMYEAQRLLADYESDLDEGTRRALEGVVTVLAFYGSSREHVKTLYFQWELINLSRGMLYVSIPSLVVALSMLLYIDTAAVTGSTLGVDNIVWLVSAAVTVTLSPFFLLVSYVLRIATVAKRTLAIGPFVLRDME